MVPGRIYFCLVRKEKKSEEGEDISQWACLNSIDDIQNVVTEYLKTMSPFAYVIAPSVGLPSSKLPSYASSCRREKGV